ncbi:heterokaryon incompatibility protein-domain-containing protein [Pyrenochaeta sp. MPI-SDFR-AT-0127]|nr:heterokaryon incompatibility protein-domain-containing protein [Pyrenochaeta sp. MPI-SDFR-AT-0127]
MVLYQYQPLDSTLEEIRILHLYPGDRDDPIRISISHVPFQPSEYKESLCLPAQSVQDDLPDTWSLYITLEGRAVFLCEPDEGEAYTSWVSPNSSINHSQHRDVEATITLGPNFEAVSYTWGSVDVLVDVQVVNAQIPSRPTETIKVGPNLHEMLGHLRQQETSRALWVDAICINQDDLVERSEQVKGMRNIFTFARRVILWLGESGADSALALQTLEYIGKQLEYTQTGYYMPSPHCTEKGWWNPRYRITLDADAWTAIAHLIQRPYFERLWIMQEIQLANQHSIVRCGDVETLWYYVRRALLKCKYDTPGLPQFSSTILQTKMEHVYHLSNDLKALDLDRLFYMASKCKCADPRDKVFAILGLVPPPFSQRIEPHYSLPVEDVYAQALETYIKVTQRLSLLGAMGKGEPENRLPSWAPNLSQLEHERLTSYYNFASGLSAAHATFNLPDELHVSGVLLDEVEVVSPIITDNLKATYQTAQELRSGETGQLQYRTSADFLDACMWVLTLGDLRDRWMDLDLVPGLQEAQALFHDFHDRKDAEFPEVYKVWSQLLLTHLASERFFITNSGYLGRGPAVAQPNDKLCVLLGYNYPVLLRPTDPNGRLVEKYRVVGPTYVHGLMEGQAILGPIPAPWKMVIRNPEKLQTSYSAVAVDPSFYNPDTGEGTRQDPRLGALSHEWEQAHKVDESRIGVFVQYHRNTNTGEMINSDPRLLPEALKSRGIPLQTIILV